MNEIMGANRPMRKHSRSAANKSNCGRVEASLYQTDVSAALLVSLPEALIDSLPPIGVDMAPPFLADPLLARTVNCEEGSGEIPSSRSAWCTGVVFF